MNFSVDKFFKFAIGAYLGTTTSLFLYKYTTTPWVQHEFYKQKIFVIFQDQLQSLKKILLKKILLINNKKLKKTFFFLFFFILFSLLSFKKKKLILKILKRIKISKLNDKMQKLFVKKVVSLTETDAGYFYNITSTTSKDVYINDHPFNINDNYSPEWMVVKDNLQIFDENTKEPLLILLKSVIPASLVDKSVEILRPVAAKSGNNNRGVAGGRIDIERIKSGGRPGIQIGKIGDFSLYPKKKNGEISSSHIGNPTDSAIIGWTDIALRNKKEQKYRMTRWVEDNMEKYTEVVPCFEYISNIFKQYLPDRWEKQSQVALPRYTKIGNSVFSTVTINSNFRSALHHDKGDFKNGMGCFFIHHSGQRPPSGQPSGPPSGQLLFPEYNIAVEMENTDFLLFNPHLWHCTAPINPNIKRTTFVCYYREKLIRNDNLINDNLINV